MAGAIWSHQWRKHPLRRTVDAVEARLLLLLCAVVFACASAIGMISGSAAHEYEQSVASQQRAARQQVSAEVLRDAAKSSPWADEAGRSALVPVPVRWVTADGADARGSALVAPGTKGGERTSLWLDRRGHVTSAPADERDIWVAALIAGAGGAAAAVGGGAVAAIGIRIMCNRCRAAGWEAEWSRVEPDWSRRA
ncbi:hypothetical protein OG206_00980 [Streptomyces sp. NBC_01341]|uniref:Rv1733c family protein n=1 Tax=Streptomyces sp. NBC_01341 TaxID=2903831 RepID=UPI002E11E61C|nr:hypothetical protein OG206_00980 [Streptomyces sp. NBC_01341]